MGWGTKGIFRRAWKEGDHRSRIALLREHAETQSPVIMAWLEEVAQLDPIMRDTLWGYHAKMRDTVTMRVVSRIVSHFPQPPGTGGYPVLRTGESVEAPLHPDGKIAEVHLGDLVRLKYDWSKRSGWAPLQSGISRYHVAVEGMPVLTPRGTGDAVPLGVTRLYLCGGDVRTSGALVFRAPLERGGITEAPAPGAFVLTLWTGSTPGHDGDQYLDGDGRPHAVQRGMGSRWLQSSVKS